MRTTIHLDDDVLAEARELADNTGRSLNSVIEEALREMLARQRKNAQPGPVQLTTVSGNGLLPGVQLDNSASLLDVMEGLDASG